MADRNDISHIISCHPLSLGTSHLSLYDIIMKYTLILALSSIVTAAPGHGSHQVQRMHKRLTPLLHEDMLSLFVDASTTSSAQSTATPTVRSGPYSNDQTHGGNPGRILALVDDSTSDSTATPIAAASRPTTPFSQSYKSVPAWSIALAVVLAVLCLSGLAAFLVYKFRPVSKLAATSTDKEDALSSYKAFWEAKRKSAGSFTCADANPAAIAADAVADSMSDQLPRYSAQADHSQHGLRR